MIRMSLPFIFQLADDLEPVGRLPEQQTTYGEVWVSLFTAETTISSLVTSSLYAPYLRTSYAAAQEFLKALRVQTSKVPFEAERVLQPWELWTIKNAYNNYRIALLAELGAAGVLFCHPKRRL